jgi:hypothetical protein
MDDGMETQIQVAVFMERVDQLQKTLEEHIDEVDNDLKAMKGDLSNINKTLTRYKGTLGGVMLALSAVGSVIVLGWSWFTKR